MSLSKEQLTDAAADERPRQPKCTRCRHHGIIVRQRGHTKCCPFLQCDCPRCFLIKERSRITGLQRSLKRVQHKPQSTDTQQTRASPAAGGPRPWALFQQSTAAPERAAINEGRPMDPRCGTDVGGERVAGSGNRDVLPFSSSAEAPSSCEFGPLATLPFIRFPFGMGGHDPRSYVPYPSLTLNMPWWPPVPAGLYNQGLCRPLMLPYIQQEALKYPPPLEPRPPADCGEVFFTLQPPPLPEAFQQKQLMEPPVAKHAEADIVELD
ncbi:doublesex- and mab-3-related transcription factor B1-like [Channa argus]|uniref:doublesex- and mab-3-related transcription factor B1-like n=1 Tax=Channa argus TaxID=215402 RepID=UPI002947B95D|nr:hypothetical protein Q8A73_000312 [Channa argus]